MGKYPLIDGFRPEICKSSDFPGYWYVRLAGSGGLYLWRCGEVREGFGGYSLDDQMAREAYFPSLADAETAIMAFGHPPTKRPLIHTPLY
jgi:hypothetical protein